ncbi:MAG: MFS transporter [Phycisphaerales bacterium]|nr:MFS transporter [Phycisphaerales bacterium]
MPTAADHSPDSTPPRRSRAIAGGVIGNLFEWYDFTIYGFFAPVIAVEFFGDGDGTAGLLKAFAVFAVGYLGRPLGAVIFGLIGDRLGRKVALLVSLAVMAVPTLGMVLIPTWQSVGILSPILLVLFRLVQGISIGGEFTGAVSYLSEQAASRHRGLCGALTVSTAMLGILMGSLVFTIMESTMSTEALQGWAWRVAFGGGLLILFAAGWVRWGMPVSSHFQEAKAAGTLVAQPVRTCFRSYRREIGYAMLLIAVPSMICYAVTISMAEFLHREVHMPRASAGLIVTIAIVLSVVIPLISGALSDRFGRRPFIRISFLGVVIWAIPMYALAGTGNMVLVWVAVLVGAVLLGIMQGAYPAALSELFPTSVRYTGTSIVYNICFAVLGGTFPLAATWLIDITGQVTAPGWYLGGVSLLVLIFIWRMPETAKSSLRSD